VFINPVQAQFIQPDKYWGIGFQLGAMTYQGDVSKTGLLESYTANSGVSLGVELFKKISPRWGLRTNLTYGNIKGDDNAQNNETDPLYLRNLSFRNTIVEGAAMLQLDLLPQKGHYTKRHAFNPYIFGGAAVFYHNPEAKTPASLGGVWVSLQSLGTEGQGVAGYGKKYDLTQIAYPVGVGFNYKISNKISLGVEFSYRFTKTDFLDDVSGKYVDKSVFGANNLARILSDRSMEATNIEGGIRTLPHSALPLSYVGADGNQYSTLYGYSPENQSKERGSVAGNDAYMTTNFSLRYILSKNENHEHLSRIHLLNQHFDITEISNRFDKYQDRYTIKNMPINTAANEMMPTFHRDGIVFVSDRKQKKTKTSRCKGNYYNLYYSPETEFKREQITKPIFMKEKEFSKMNYWAVSSSVHASNVIFAMFPQNNNKADRKVHKLYSADVEGEYYWKNVVPLPFGSRYYSVSQPTLSADATTLYFVSDQEGGQGGTDIYMSKFIDGKWSQPMNVGAPINTQGNEMYPFIHPDGTLYFASDGHKGMGGLDIFEAIPDKKRTKFLRVANLGTPINSFFDDYGLVLDEVKRKGYFTSDRPAGKGGNDIYELRVDKLNLSRQLTDEADSLIEVHNVVIKGTIINKDTKLPIPKAIVKLRNTMSEELLLSKTTETGEFHYTVQNDALYEIGASSIGYEPFKTMLVSTIGKADSADIELRLELQPHHYKLTIKGVIKDELTENHLANVGITVINLDKDHKVQTSTFSNERGEYEIQLEKDYNFMIFVSEKGYADKSLQISTHNKQHSKAAILNLNLKPQSIILSE
jgi:opacity protein-like surface antigen